MPDSTAANSRLLTTYEQAWHALRALEAEADGVSGPHLPLVPDGYDEAEIRVAVVGQQTQGWDWAESADGQARLYPADGIVAKKRGSPFWRAAREVTDALAGRPDSPVLWANLVGIDVGKGRPPKAIRDAVRSAVPPHGVLYRVLETVRPDAAVFFTGRNEYYRSELERQFEGVETEPVSGYDENVLVQLSHPALPQASFRTYHPKYLRLRKLWHAVDALPDLIRKVRDEGR